MLLHSCRLILSVAIALIVFSECCRAGILAGSPAIYGPGTPLGVPVGETVTVNNDNVSAGNPNQISLVGIDVTGLDPIDVVVPVANSPGASGTTEYFLTLGTAANMTESTWNGFVIELGSGIAGAFMRLSDRAITGVSGLDFDTPDRDPVVSSPSFPAITHDSDLLTFSGGVVAVGEVASAQNFSIDIPDTTSPGTLTYDFTIRLRPLVVPVLEGDFDGDGEVDGSDFLIWQRDPSVGRLSDWQDNYAGGGSPQAGDFDRDGDVDGRDLLVWQRDTNRGVLSAWQNNYGSALTDASIPVPEPTGMMLLVEVVEFCCRRQRRAAGMASIPSAIAAACGNR